ncbi:unnamed protein product [[Candida] boidinii]|uniref:Unnamed protein product n=1 Tax=Candida boidinii TaxID=5477 RepID=A0A9W6SVD8_CANBO|nr:hypothetical protein B5S33_g5048 [[Candida] boidinii]GME67762.1 unnamed protein product [[Candida] boidinii]GME87492.1 unnamed protein product [[Candida] boidinii]GMF97882.1 unnamed protein product [[Candida] boidinii]
MSDLDDDLLALAGSPDEDASGSDYEPEYNAPKSADVADLAASDDEDDDRDPYPIEGKYKDEQDRARLMEMDEVEREEILFERIQEMEKFRERKYLALRARQSKAERSINESKVSKGRALRTSKLTELKKQREKKTKREQRRNRRDDYSDEDEFGEDEDEDDEEDDLAIDEEEGSDYEDAIDTRRSNKRRREDLDEEIPSGPSGRSKQRDVDLDREANLDDINSRVRVGRTAVGKYLYHDEFVDVIPGTYIRFNIGVDRDTGRQQYRVCKIEEVKRHGGAPYTFLGKPCDTYLVISQGNSKKTCQMVFLSDSPITTDEFENYKKRVTDAGLRFPTKADIDEKFKELRKMSTRELTDEDITRMVQLRESVSVEGMESGNRVRKLAVLKEQLDVAIENNDTDNISRLEQEIQRLSNASSTKSVNVDAGMAKVNYRNKRYTETSIRKAEARAVELRKIQLLTSNQNADPFSRLRTNPKIFYSADIVDPGSAAASSAAIAADEEDKTESEKKLDEAKVKEELKTMLNSKYKTKGIDSVIKEIDFDLGFSI